MTWTHAHRTGDPNSSMPFLTISVKADCPDCDWTFTKTDGRETPSVLREYLEHRRTERHVKKPTLRDVLTEILDDWHAVYLTGSHQDLGADWVVAKLRREGLLA